MAIRPIAALSTRTFIISKGNYHVEPCEAKRVGSPRAAIDNGSLERSDGRVGELFRYLGTISGTVSLSF